MNRVVKMHQKKFQVMGKDRGPVLIFMNLRIIGAASEHYVICRLLRRRYGAVQAPES